MGELARAREDKDSVEQRLMLAESDKGLLKGEIEAINMSASLMHVSVTPPKKKRFSMMNESDSGSQDPKPGF
jgi:hypothetical protein